MSSLHTASEARGFIARRYNALTALGSDEDFLRGAIEGPIDHLPRGRDICVEGKPLPGPRYLLSGWACRIRLLGDGRRIVLGFILPGDGIGVCAHPHPLALASITTVSPCTIVQASPALGPGEALGDHPNLRRAIATAKSMDEAFALDQIVRLGRQTALERLAHLLLELHWRLAAVHLAIDWRFHAPLTQEVLADATGLSIVHVNRTVQHLRREKLIEWKNHTLCILRPDILIETAEYRPPPIAEWN